jgi:hypothetical protein
VLGGSSFILPGGEAPRHQRTIDGRKELRRTLHAISFEDHVAYELARASYGRQRHWLLWSTLSLGVLTGLAIALARLTDLTAWPAWAIPAALTALCGAAWAYYEWCYRSHSRLRSQLQAGLEGQRVLPEILSCLDDRYYLINNLKLPGRSDDVDHMVVGPNGVFALETKHHRGHIYSRDGQWYQSKVSRQGRPQPEVAIRDPTRQLKRNVDYLRSCINHTDPELSHRCRLWIEGTVVFTHPAVDLDLPDEAVAALPFPVLRAQDLSDHITSHVPRRTHSRKEIRQIVSLLGHLRAPG